MRPRDLVVVGQLFLRSARVQQKRALLTIAAIGWGTVALLLLLAFGEGLKRQMSRGNAGMGSNLAIVFPGETTKHWQGLPPGRPTRLKLDDVRIVRERVRGIDEIVGEMRRWGRSVTYGRKTINTRVNGTSTAFGDLRNHIARPGGRFLNDQDDLLRRRVMFLGDEVATDLFGAEEPVGKEVRLDGAPYTVIGVLQKKMQMGSYGGPDATGIVIPIQTFLAQYGRDLLENLVVRPEDPAHMKEMLTSLRETLGARHAFDPTDEPALGVWDTVESSKMMANIMFGIQLFLGIIGGLTLVIGGVGVANIMYATVKERTREIGVKMALGARRSWVTGPLVLEGLIYTIVGGLLGLLVAVLLIVALGLIPTEGNEALEFLGKPTLSPAVGLSAAGVLGVIGILSAYFPARRAAAIDPAETLRYE